MFHFYICHIYNTKGLSVLNMLNFPYNLLLAFDMQGVRRLGAAAVDMCHVALGIVEAYWEYRLKPWDMAAGVLVIFHPSLTIYLFNIYLSLLFSYCVIGHYLVFLLDMWNYLRICFTLVVLCLNEKHLGSCSCNLSAPCFMGNVAENIDLINLLVIYWHWSSSVVLSMSYPETYKYCFTFSLVFYKFVHALLVISVTAIYLLNSHAFM